MSDSELMVLLEKQNQYIEEKLQSDKLLEGLLKDISESLDRIAGAIEEQK